MLDARASCPTFFKMKVKIELVLYLGGCWFSDGWVVALILMIALDRVGVIALDRVGVDDTVDNNEYQPTLV